MTPVHAGEQALDAPWVLSYGALRFGEKPGPKSNRLIGLYAEWFPRVGLQASLVPYPPKRALADANAGLIAGDAARSSVDSSVFTDLHQVPEPVLDVVFAGLYISDDVSISSLADFKHYRFGYVRGWSLAEDLFADLDKAVAVRNPALLLDMLNANQLDVIFFPVSAGRAIAREKDMPALRSTEFTRTKPLYLYLHSKHRDRIPELAAALRHMKSDGSYDRVMEAYTRENR